MRMRRHKVKPSLLVLLINMYRFMARGVSLSLLLGWVFPTLVCFRKATYSIIVCILQCVVLDRPTNRTVLCVRCAGSVPWGRGCVELQLPDTLA